MENNTNHKSNNKETASPLWVAGGLIIFLMLIVTATSLFIQYSMKNNSYIMKGEAINKQIKDTDRTTDYYIQIKESNGDKVILPIISNFHCKKISGKTSLELFNYVQENKSYKFQIYNNMIINAYK